MLESLFFIGFAFVIFLTVVIVFATIIAIIEIITDTIIVDWPEKIRGFFR